MLPIHQIESATMSETRQDIFGGLRPILCAGTLAECHAAIGCATSLLESKCSVALCVTEIAPTPHGAELVWQAGDPTLENASAISSWFGNARLHLGRRLNFRENCSFLMMGHGDQSAVYVAILAGSAFLSPTLESGMRDLADFAARQLKRLRWEDELHQRQSRLHADAKRNRALVCAGADLTWQSDAEGTIHITEIFHDRRDLARALEGVTLKNLVSNGAELKTMSRDGMRAQRLAVPGLSESLLLSASPDPCDANLLRGIIVAEPDMSAAKRVTEAYALETIVAGRQREERLRFEAEVTMLGLRLLLSDFSFREKLARLAQHFAGAIHCDEVRLVVSRPGEGPRLLLPDGIPTTDAALECTVALGESGLVTSVPIANEKNAVVCAGLGIVSGEVIIVALPAEIERYYLLARARRPLSDNDYGLIERMSLLLKQAFSLQADQKRMIHAAKLSALGQMSTSVAHELRQPLNAISLSAQNIELMAGLDHLEPELLQEKVTRILNQIDRATKIMDRMRRFGRKSAGEYKLVSVAAIARSARSLMDAVATAASVSVEVAIAEEHQILADELELEQVLVNLIQNAIDAIAEDRKGRTQAGRIRIWSEYDQLEDRNLRICIEDNGPGFGPQVREHALEAFFTTKPEGKGTGLGLSIAHAILREHGGRLLLEHSDAGGLVTLVLPRANGEASSISHLRSKTGCS
jgi:signal transduction histidine kinase